MTPPRSRHRGSAGTAEPGSVDWVGPAEIARRFGVGATAVANWSVRSPSLPPADHVVSRVPVRDWRAVELWARETGRLHYLAAEPSTHPASPAAKSRGGIMGALRRAFSAATRAAR